MHDNFYFSFLENIDEIVSTRSVNIAEGDLIVAEYLVLVAVVHHQVVCHELSGKSQSAASAKPPCPEDRSL